jgi:4-amino-4-deoxy-L-arabinose transferase-like glycosyltransferase
MVVVWAGFTLRLLFYSAMLPLWEGYDEWAHFSVIRHMAVKGVLLPVREAPIPRDVEASFQLAAVPWEMRSLPPPSLTQDQYWELSRAEREGRERELRAMPAAWGREDGQGPFTSYEALQPPLYYWIMAPAMLAIRGMGAGLAAQVMALRFLSALLASLTVPLVFLIGRQVWPDGRVAMGCAAIAAVMPGLALDVARVGNDCLAVVLFTLLTWLAVRMVQEGVSLRLAVWTGAVVGLGLLTKAYFLTAVPALFLVLLFDWWRARGRRAPVAARALLLASVSLLLAGWWYLRNLRSTGTLSGLSEALMLRGVAPGQMLRQAAGLNWARAIDTILFSHLYFGGWSSLTVRSWMYHIFYVAIVAAFLGLLRLLRLPAILTLLLVYLSFWLGELYNVLLLYVSKGLAASMGWYMYAVVGAEVVLTVAGLRRLLPARAGRWVVPAGAVLFALLDLYTVHGVAIPYYTGMIRHKANGSLGALHWAGFQIAGMDEICLRLTVFKSPLFSVPVLVVLWLLFLAGTVAAVACAARELLFAADERR